MWLWNLVEIGQLFNLTILARQTGKVSRPDVTTVARSFEVSDHVRKWSIKSVSIDADHFDALIDQPQNSVTTKPRLTEIVFRVNPFVGSRLQ